MCQMYSNKFQKPTEQGVYKLSALYEEICSDLLEVDKNKVKIYKNRNKIK